MYKHIIHIIRGPWFIACLLRRLDVATAGWVAWRVQPSLKRRNLRRSTSWRPFGVSGWFGKKPRWQDNWTRVIDLISGWFGKLNKLDMWAALWVFMVYEVPPLQTHAGLESLDTADTSIQNVHNFKLTLSLHRKPGVDQGSYRCLNVNRFDSSNKHFKVHAYIYIYIYIYILVTPWPPKR